MLIAHENKIKAQSEDILFINKICYDIHPFWSYQTIS